MSNVTMREIGRMLGVSAVTVSKALAGKNGVSESVRQRIIKTAAELGYVNPNDVRGQEARALDVGILVPDQFFSADSFYAMFYKQLVHSLTDAGHFGVLELLSAEMETSLTLPNLLRSGRVDALIILGQPSRSYVRMVTSQPVPVVFLDFYDEYAGADAVVADNAYGCARLTTHLIHNGHTDIGFVGTCKATSSIMDRYLGYYRAMLMHDLPIREEWIITDRDDKGRVLDRLVLPEQLPTALVCNCDLTARMAIETLNEAGYRVPEDISVVGFDDFSGGNALPALSTFRTDVTAMAQMAVKLAVERCCGGRKPFGRVVVGGQPVYRDSEGPVKR